MSAITQFFLVVAGCACVGAVVTAAQVSGGANSEDPVSQVKTRGGMSLVEALARRRSVRSFRSEELTSQQIAQLCWAGQGVTESSRGYRTAPSAGALYPLELFVVTGEGVEHYIPSKHAMEEHLTGDLRRKLQRAALGQESVGNAPAVFVFSAVISRTQRKYGNRAERYVWIEAGHAAQNILLQATAMELGAVPIGAFQDNEVKRILKLPPNHTPLYLIPVGSPVE